MAPLICITCNRMIQEKIRQILQDENIALFAAFIVVALLTGWLTVLATRRSASLSKTPLFAAASILGIGMGGFIDGILLHQILQWHEMLTGKLPADTLVNKSVNMFWDGIFHLFTWLIVLAGILLLWRVMQRPDTKKSGRLLTGGLLFGWGLFNLAEGSINHNLLGLHNVNEFSVHADRWNYAFLILGLAQAVLGWLLFRAKAFPQKP
jgi:uncharacterized membrane protein